MNIGNKAFYKSIVLWIKIPKVQDCVFFFILTVKKKCSLRQKYCLFRASEVSYDSVRKQLLF